VAKQISIDLASIAALSLIFVKRALTKLSLGRKTLAAVNLLRLRASESAKRPRRAYTSKTEDQIALDNAYFTEALLSRARPATSPGLVTTHDQAAGVSTVDWGAPTATIQVSPGPARAETISEAPSTERLHSDVAASFLPPALRRSEPASEVHPSSDVVAESHVEMPEVRASADVIPESQVELPETHATAGAMPESHVEMPEVHASADAIPESQVELPETHATAGATPESHVEMPEVHSSASGILCETHLEALEMDAASDAMPESIVERASAGSAESASAPKTSPSDQRGSDLRDPLSSRRPLHADVEVVLAAEAAAEAAIASGTVYERAFALSSPLKSATGNRTQKNKELKTNPFYTLAAVAAASAMASAAAAVATTAGAVTIAATAVGAAVDAYTIARSRAANQKEKSPDVKETDLLDCSSETETKWPE